VNSGEEKPDPKQWLEYARFCLKFGMKEKADYFMKRYSEESGVDDNMNLILGTLHL